MSSISSTTIPVSNLFPLAPKVISAINEMAPRLRTYPYVRFSTKRKAKDDSLARQVDRCRRQAAEHDLDLNETTFEDLGVSAFDRSKITRGALAAFMDAVEAGALERGSYLLVESLDQLSRVDVTEPVTLL